MNLQDKTIRRIEIALLIAGSLSIAGMLALLGVAVSRLLGVADGN